MKSIQQLYPVKASIDSSKGSLIFAFRPHSGKQKNKAKSLRAPRLCGEIEIYNVPPFRGGN
jgi:hypothetical protein